MKEETYVKLTNLPYMCGASKAYLIKDAEAAAKISVTDFLALSATAQTANGAYYSETRTGTFSATNLRNPITIDKFNPNSGRYSNGFITGVTYPYGAYVNQANRVFVCNSAVCATDPVADKAGAIWTFKNTEAAPPSRRVQIDGEYDPKASYFEGDFVLHSGNWYTCVTKDRKKIISNKTYVLNDCNIKFSGDLSANKTFRQVGADGTLDFTQPVVASPFSTDVDWQLNDFYADTDNKKVYQCTGGVKKDSTLCRTKYALNTDQWKDVTSVTNNGVTISNWSDAFTTNKAQPRLRKGWFPGSRYMKGDIVEVENATNHGLMICKGTDCSTKSPLDVWGTGTAQTDAKAQWSEFSTAFEAANADFGLYDINVNNFRAVVELNYAGWGNRVKCDSDTTAAASATLENGKTICDTANGATAPFKVRVCNSTKTGGCVNLTSAQVSALPLTRDDGYTTKTPLTAFYTYAANTRFQKDDIVEVLDAANAKHYYSVGPYNFFAAATVGPLVAGNDVWIHRGDIDNANNVTPSAAPTTSPQACVSFDVVPLYNQLWDFYLGFGYTMLDFGEFELAQNSYICDVNRVYKCNDSSDLCQWYTPDEFDLIWDYEPLKTPTIGATPTFDNVVVGKLYTEFQYDPVEEGDIYFKVNGNNYDAYQCIASMFNLHKCTTTDPATDTTQTYWKKLDTAGKILIKMTSAGQSVTKKTYANSAEADVTHTYGGYVWAYPQIRYNEYKADKTTKYVDFKFELYDTVASDDGFVFYCWDQTIPCKDADPVDLAQTSWKLIYNVLASEFATIPVVQVLDGVTWVAGTPYMEGDVICDAWGQAVIVQDGFTATFKNVEDYDDTYWSVYEPLWSYYYACNLVAAKTYTEQAAKDFQHLVTFDKSTGAYSTVTAGTKVFMGGRIFECVQESDCASFKPGETESTWRLTDYKGVIEPNLAAITISEAVPTLTDCLDTDDLKAQTTAAYTYNFSANQLLTVKNAQVCSTDAELKRKLHAGDAIFKNIEGGAVTGLPYNMIVYKQAVNPNWINTVTLGKDFTIRAKHIETAFASFPLFCGDAPAGVDPILSCKQDLAGFFTYLRMFAESSSFDFQGQVKFWQTGFDHVVDKDCWSLANAAGQGLDLNTGLTMADCTHWINPLANDVSSQYPEFKTAYYFARGSNPLPLIGARDYGMFSQNVLEKEVLLEKPDLAEDPRLTTLIAMWRYMSYGVNGTTGPSIHDIFTGHWTPNAEELAAGLTASNKVNAALAVVYDSLPGNDGTKSCAEYYNVISLGDVYSTYASQLGLDAAELAQDFKCTNVSAYPRGKGPNAGYWLKYEATATNCQLTSEVTEYHAFRSGDLKFCLADAAANGDFVAAALSIKSTTKWYTEHDPKYPYVVGSLAAYKDNATPPTFSCRYCKTGFDCVNPPGAAATADWVLCDG